MTRGPSELTDDDATSFPGSLSPRPPEREGGRGERDPGNEVDDDGENENKKRPFYETATCACARRTA